LLDFAWTLIRTDLKVRYHGSFGGFFYALLYPIVMFLTLLGVFSFLFTSQKSYAMNLIIGLALWDFFQEASRVGLMNLHAKKHLATKVAFPPWIVCAAAIPNALLRLVVFTVCILAYRALSGHVVGLERMVLLFFYLLCLIVIVFGFSLAASVLFLLFRDLNQIWEVTLSAGFFVAPIIYPMDILPERYHFILYLWPPTPVIQFSRDVIMGNSIPTLYAHILLIGMTLWILLAGLAIHKRYLNRAIEKL